MDGQDLVRRGDIIEAIEGTTWYHINCNGVLVHGANGEDDTPLYKAEDIYNAINSVQSAQQKEGVLLNV